MAALVAAVVLAVPSCHGLTDGILCMPLPSGWHSAVGPGHTPRGPAAWMLAGNFRFPKDAAKHEASPIVPPQRVLITIGDFPILDKKWERWGRVERVRLPRRSTTKRLVSWHVRFAHCALFLSVRFGSKPDATARRLVNRRLESVRRIG